MELYAATDMLFSDMLNLCVWNKNNGGMGSLYRSKHELVGVFKHGKAPHINNVQLGKFGRDRTNVWDYPGVSSFGKNRNEALAMHPTVKPVSMLADILLDASRGNDIVVDGFLGSGSTLMAAEKVHRRCFGVEIEPRYVDVILQRYRNETGIEPMHVESGLTLTELVSQRSQAQGVSL
jgi:DNA modification methylase